MVAGCASARAWRRRPYARSWPPWSPRDAELSGGGQGVLVHGSVRYAPLVRRTVHAGRARHPVQSFLGPLAGVLQSAQRPGEDPVLGPGWVGNLVQAPGGGHLSVSLRHDGTEGERGLGTGSAARGHRPEPGEAAPALQPAGGDKKGGDRKGRNGDTSHLDFLAGVHFFL